MGGGGVSPKFRGLFWNFQSSEFRGFCANPSKFKGFCESYPEFCVNLPCSDIQVHATFQPPPPSPQTVCFLSFQFQFRLVKMPCQFFHVNGMPQPLALLFLHQITLVESG